MTKNLNFSLVQIVDYCKKRVEWDDAKIIVAMMNDLTRRIALEEEIVELIDSIEESFKKIAFRSLIPEVPNSSNITSIKQETIDHQKNTQKQSSDMPTCEEMCRAVVETIKQGLWWSNRSWAVVYRVYQMKGYVSGFSQFVRDVRSWKIKIGFECNYDALQKPISSGMFAGHPDTWEDSGAPSQAVKLAKALLKELEKKKSS